MSDTQQGSDWWLASDGKWYPPERHPDYVAPQSLPEPPPGHTGRSTPPTYVPPARATGPVDVNAPAEVARSSSGSKLPWVIAAVAIVVAAVTIGVAVGVGMGGEDPVATGAVEDAPTTTAGTTPAPTTTVRTTTTTISECVQLTDELIETLGTTLDRVDTDAAGASDALDAVGDVLNDGFRELGRTCGPSGSGPAVSSIVVYLAREGSERGGASAITVDGFLSGFCPAMLEADVELTLAAEAACAGR